MLAAYRVPPHALYRFPTDVVWSQHQGEGDLWLLCHASSAPLIYMHDGRSLPIPATPPGKVPPEVVAALLEMGSPSSPSNA